MLAITNVKKNNYVIKLFRSRNVLYKCLCQARFYFLHISNVSDWQWTKLLVIKLIWPLPLFIEVPMPSQIWLCNKTCLTPPSFEVLYNCYINEYQWKKWYHNKTCLASPHFIEVPVPCQLSYLLICLMLTISNGQNGYVIKLMWPLPLFIEVPVPCQILYVLCLLLCVRLPMAENSYVIKIWKK